MASEYEPDGVFDKKAQIKSLGSLPLYVTNQGRIEKGLAIDEQLAALGIHPADLDLVLLSHLDCDHTNGLNLVADAKQILVSKDELLFAENKTPVNRIRYNADWWRSTKMQTFDWNGTEGLAGKSYDVFGDESLVIAKSYARIFFRNSINNGLLLIENADLHDEVTEGDTIDVEVNAQITHNGKAYPIASLPDNLVDILNAGGLVKAMRKLNGLD